MAVPSAVLKQRERLEQELGINADGTPLATPPVVASDSQPASVPEISPVAAPTPQQPADIDASAARIKELEHLLSTRDGQTSAAMREINQHRERAELLASQVRALEESVERITKQAETAEARAAAKQADLALNFDPPEELTEQEITTFGEDSVGFVKKLTKKELIQLVKPLVDKVNALEKQVGRVSELDRLPQLEKTVQNAEAETQRVREEEFFRKEVLAYFSDFEAVRESPGWQDYLRADIPGRGIKNHHLLDQYRKVHNAQGIRSLIQVYYDAVKAKPTMASLATPRGTQTEGTVPVKPNMKASDYLSKLRAFTSRNLPKKDWDAFKVAFEQARNEGRVDMDARL